MWYNIYIIYVIYEIYIKMSSLCELDCTKIRYVFFSQSFIFLGSEGTPPKINIFAPDFRMAGKRLFPFGRAHFYVSFRECLSWELKSWEPKGTLPMPHPPPKKFSALKGGTIKPWAPSQGETHSIHDFPPPRSTFWGCVFWYAFLSPRWVPTTRELQPNWHPSFSHRVLVPFFRKNNMADQQGD